MGKLFGNRIIAWYSIDTLMRIQDNFIRMHMDLSKVREVIDKSIEHHVNVGWKMVGD